MIVWRIAHKRFADLSGIGGLHVSGRWHSKGKPVCYFAEHPALAMLEVRVHMDLEAALLSNYVMLRVSVPDDLAMDEISEVSADENATQRQGDAWLAAAQTAMIKVPSAILRDSYNYLTNPQHPDSADLELLEAAPVEFDLGLFK